MEKEELFSKPVYRNMMAWIESESTIRSLILVGSLAKDGYIDQWSDFDVSAFCTDTGPFNDLEKWTSKLGRLIACERNQNEGGTTNLLVFDDGTEVDITFEPLKILEEMVNSGTIDPMYDQGYRVLGDKDGLAGQLVPPTGTGELVVKPERAEFFRIVNMFWYEAYKVGKALHRHDMWHSKYCNWDTKECLIRMIEWHESAQKGWLLSRSYYAKKMKNWVSAEIMKETREVFSGMDVTDSWRDLSASMRRFHRLSSATARMGGFKYTDDSARAAMKIISSMQSR
ncbi:MAG: aminoglycoside 6-adenylyltransferase [Spirochaetales bacterium]|nr:aminoglycoside 6-adenylyltransferase [Spirochaetales bacterium]